jgi:hypothetical protein
MLDKRKGEHGTLAFDGGEFTGEFYYAGVLSFLYLLDPPTLVCFKKGIKSQEEMATEIANVIIEISKTVRVIAILIDGLLYQIQAVHLFPTGTTTPGTKTNIQYHLTEHGFKMPLPYHLVDLPHIFQLTLTHARDNFQLMLNSYITEVDDLAADLRTREAVAFIKARCPSYPATRFFYVVLRMLFMQRKADAIVEYYNKFTCLCVCFFSF